MLAIFVKEVNWCEMPSLVFQLELQKHAYYGDPTRNVTTLIMYFAKFAKINKQTTF